MASPDSQLLQVLVDQGFPKIRAEKALLQTNNAGVEVAVDWLIAHAEDADIDVPFGGTPSSVSLVAIQREKRAVHDAEHKAAEEKVQLALAQLQEDERREKEAREVERAKIQDMLSRRGPSREYEEQIRAFEDKVQAQEAAQRERMKVLTQQTHLATLKQFEIDRRARAERDDREREKREAAAAADKARVDTLKKLTQIQVRLFDGTAVKEAFEPATLLKHVKDWITRQVALQAFAAAAASAVSPDANAAEEDSEDSEDDGPIAAGMHAFPGAPRRQPQTSGVRLGDSLDSPQHVSSHATPDLDISAVPAFNIVCMFPRKVYSDADMDKTLQQLGLHPSAALQITKR